MAGRFEQPVIGRITQHEMLNVERHGVFKFDKSRERHWKAFSCGASVLVIVEWLQTDQASVDVSEIAPQFIGFLLTPKDDLWVVCTAVGDAPFGMETFEKWYKLNLLEEKCGWPAHAAKALVASGKHVYSGNIASGRLVTASKEHIPRKVWESRVRHIAALMARDIWYHRASELVYVSEDVIYPWQSFWGLIIGDTSIMRSLHGQARGDDDSRLSLYAGDTSSALGIAQIRDIQWNPPLVVYVSADLAYTAYSSSTSWRSAGKLKADGEVFEAE
jgi:hypothetical protein